MMAQSVMILGRQPALGLAELESLFGVDKLHPLGTAAILDIDPADVPMHRLGGTIKACKLLTQLPFTDWSKVTDYLIEHVPKHTCCYGPGKLTFGISTYGLKVSPRAINATALAVKKAVKAPDRPVRVVPNVSLELNSAQVLHNKMTDLPLGMELVLVREDTSVWLAQTFAVQDIEAYAARDQKRPKRDARVGMLPPKLAQIIINIAGIHVPPNEKGQIDKTSTRQNRLARLLDPFCGTGVILQEALLMGYDVFGADLELRMTEYSRTNLAWLTQKQNVAGSFEVRVGDATNLVWQPPFDLIATETYLGRPFSALPRPEILSQVLRDVDLIHKKFLQNLARQTKPGFRACIAVPAWKTKNGFKHLKTLDHLEELGYTRLSFTHVRNEDLIYHRPDQIVARELVVLKRK